MTHLFEQIEKEEAINQLKIDLMSRFYPFSKAELIENSSTINFGYSYLMANDSIQWDIEMIETLKDKIDWDGLWKIKGITIDHDFIKKYEDRFSFDKLPPSKCVSWTLEIVKDYEDRLDWSGSISSIELFNNYDILKTYSEKLDWDKVSLYNSLVSSEEFIKEFENKLNWKKLSANKNLPISPEFIYKYKDKLDINLISRLLSSLEFIFKYPTEINWNWDLVSVNYGIEYNEQTFNFIFNHYKKYHQSKVFKGRALQEFALHDFLYRIFNFYRNDKTYFVSEKFIELFHCENKFGYIENKSASWFIENSKSKLNFKYLEFIRDYKSIITTKYVEDNLDLYDPDDYTFYNLPITQEIVKKLGVKVNWNKLSSCTKLDWTWEFIESNWDKLNKYRLSENKGLYDKLIANNLNKSEIFVILNEYNAN
jgi:hypothetical protein